MTPEDIENRFGWHKATIEGKSATLPQHDMLRTIFKEFATKLNEALPSGRYKSLCLTELENASMWSHKAIAELAQSEDVEALLEPGGVIHFADENFGQVGYTQKAFKNLHPDSEERELF